MISNGFNEDAIRRGTKETRGRLEVSFRRSNGREALGQSSHGSPMFSPGCRTILPARSKSSYLGVGKPPALTPRRLPIAA